MTFRVELPKLLGSPTTSYSLTAAERKFSRAGASFENATNGKYVSRPDSDRRLMDASFERTGFAQSNARARFDSGTFTIEGPASRRSSISSLGSLTSRDLRVREEAVRSAERLFADAADTGAGSRLDVSPTYVSELTIGELGALPRTFSMRAGSYLPANQGTHAPLDRSAFHDVTRSRRSSVDSMASLFEQPPSASFYGGDEDAGSAVDVGSRHTSVWSADVQSRNSGDRTSAWDRTSLRSLSDAGAGIDDVSIAGRSLASSSGSIHRGGRGLMVELPMLGRGRGADSAHALGGFEVHAAHASKHGSGILGRFRDAFAGIWNFIKHGGSHKSHEGKWDSRRDSGFDSRSTSIASRDGASVLHDTYGILQGGRDQLLTSIPRLETMLGPRSSQLDAATFKREFRKLEHGLSAFAALARKQAHDGRLSDDIADRLNKLASRNTVIANGQTAMQLWGRMWSGDSGFLAEARSRSELHSFVEAVKHEVLNFAVATRNTRLALQLQEAWQPTVRSVGTQTVESSTLGANWRFVDDAGSDISLDGYSDNAIREYGLDDFSADSLDVYAEEMGLGSLGTTTPQRVSR